MVEVQLQQPQSAGDGHHTFPKGHPRYGGRPKGRQNRFGGDLREAVVLGIQAVGFMEKDKKGWKHGTGGVQGFIEWLALHEPKTAAALFARVLPYFINVGGEVPEVVSETEMEAMLKELGLPLGLIEHMQSAPAPLDLDEDPDPYGMHAEAAARAEVAAEAAARAEVAAKGAPDAAAE